MPPKLDTTSLIKIHNRVWFSISDALVLYEDLDGCFCGFYVQQNMESSVAFQVTYAKKYRLPEIYSVLPIDSKQQSMLLVAINNPDFIPKVKGIGTGTSKTHCDRCRHFQQKNLPQVLVTTSDTPEWQFRFQTLSPQTLGYQTLGPRAPTTSRNFSFLEDLCDAIKVIEQHGNIIDKMCPDKSVILQALIMRPHFISFCTGHVCRSPLPRDNCYYTVTDFSEISTEDFAVLYELNKFKVKRKCSITEYKPSNYKCAVEQNNEFIVFDKEVADYVKLNLILFLEKCELTTSIFVYESVE